MDQEFSDGHIITLYPMKEEHNAMRNKLRSDHPNISLYPCIAYAKISQWILGDNMILWLPFYFFFFCFFVALVVFSNKFKTPVAVTFILLPYLTVSYLY